MKDAGHGPPVRVWEVTVALRKHGLGMEGVEVEMVIDRVEGVRRVVGIGESLMPVHPVRFCVEVDVHLVVHVLLPLARRLSVGGRDAEEYEQKRSKTGKHLKENGLEQKRKTERAAPIVRPSILNVSPASAKSRKILGPARITNCMGAFAVLQLSIVF